MTEHPNGSIETQAGEGTFDVTYLELTSSGQRAEQNSRRGFIGSCDAASSIAKCRLKEEISRGS